MQIFLCNPRGWASSPGDPAVDASLRAAAEAREMPVLVHAPYLNLGSPTVQTYQCSVAALAHTLRRGREIGATGVVETPGGPEADAADLALLASLQR